MAKNKCQLKSVVDGRGSSSRLVYDDCVIAVFEFCAKSQKTIEFISRLYLLRTYNSS